MTPRLSILMSALASRVSPMRPLIESQISGRQGVEFLITLDNGETASGAKRQCLLERARGEYVAFVDDDDEVAPGYVADILDRATGVDVVTFDMELIRPGRKLERWQLGLHADDRARGKMAANHLCAWRRELALRVGWAPIGYGDDQLWYGPLHASGLARTEAHVDGILYRYLWSPVSTVNQQAEKVVASRRYFGAGIPCYRDRSGEIYIEVDGSQPRETEFVTGYRRGELATVRRSELELFHVARLQ